MFIRKRRLNILRNIQLHDQTVIVHDKNFHVNEIKMFLGGEEEDLDSVWMKILNDADTNGDGVIDLEEFKNIMLSEINS